VFYFISFNSSEILTDFHNPFTAEKIMNFLSSLLMLLFIHSLFGNSQLTKFFILESYLHHWKPRSQTMQ